MNLLPYPEGGTRYRESGLVLRPDPVINVRLSGAPKDLSRLRRRGSSPPLNQVVNSSHDFNHLELWLHRNQHDPCRSVLPNINASQLPLRFDQEEYCCHKECLQRQDSL